MCAEITSIAEEYLETIYRLEQKEGAARTGEIASDLGVALGTVTNTIEHMEGEGLVSHVPYRGVKLTSRGLKGALNVIRRHRLSERLLTDMIGVGWADVHAHACRLEHGLSDEIIKPLEKALKHPKTCPHGNPIPTKYGEIIEEESEPLTALNEREGGTVVKITEEKADLLRYLDTMGLVPGASINVIEKAPFDGPITIKVGEAKRAISRSMASVIQVKRTT